MIVLMILRVLALIFVSVLALALFVILLLLIVPIRCRLNADYNGKPDIQFEARWLFRIFTIIYSKSGIPLLTLKVFGISVKRRHKPPKKKLTDTDKVIANNDEAFDYNNEGIEHPTVKGKMTEDDEKPSSVIKKKRLKENWDKFIAYPYKEMLVNKTILLLKRLIKATKPKDGDVECCFGFEDPSVTGILLGAVHALCGACCLYKYIRITADFEKEYLYLKCRLEGSIRLGSLVWPLIAYIVSKPVWILVKPLIFKKKEKGRSL
jgi:hypothetical protein